VIEEFADTVPECLDGSFGSLSQERLQFREHHLDRIEVRRVARQETQCGALGRDRFPDFRALVRGEIVDQDDVSFKERWSKHLFDIGEKAFAIDRAIEHERGRDAIMTKRGDERRRLPMAVRRLGVKPLAAPAASMCGRHVGLRPVSSMNTRRLGSSCFWPSRKHCRSAAMSGRYGLGERGPAAVLRLDCSL
jgi:hypothetical protein